MKIADVLKRYLLKAIITYFTCLSKRYILTWATLGYVLMCSKPATTSHESALSGCGDLLVISGYRLPNLQFSHCLLTSNAQSRVVRAIYKVDGSQARGVQGYLIGKFGMKPLRFICCGWESPNGAGTFRDSQGYHYRVQMHSSDTVEKQWSRIKEFFVTVDRFDEQP